MSSRRQDAPCHIALPLPSDSKRQSSMNWPDWSGCDAGCPLRISNDHPSFLEILETWDRDFWDQHVRLGPLQTTTTIMIIIVTTVGHLTRAATPATHANLLQPRR